jgi:hypothetical protein
MISDIVAVMKTNNPLLIAVFCLVVLGCGGSVTIPPDVKARIDFAQKQDSETAFRNVLFHADGKDKEILNISVVDDVAPYAVEDTIDLLISDKLKKDAKSLGFKQITIEGGSRSFTEKDTIHRTMDLD